MFSKLTLIGNLGQDPDLRYTPAGDAVVNFSLATNRTWKDNDGTQHKETTWFRCSAWRKLAEVINQYLAKGRLVYVEGRLIPEKESGGPRIYTRKDGTSGAGFELLVENIKFLGGRPDDSTNGESESEPAGDEGVKAPAPLNDDSLPF